MLNKQLAKIENATLNVTDRGMLTFYITVKYEEGMNQVVGGLSLDQWDEEKERRVGTAYGCEMIIQMLKLFNVDSFEKMKDKLVYVLGEGSGLSFTPKGLQNLRVNDNKETKIVFEDVLNEMVKHPF